MTDSPDAASSEDDPSAPAGPRAERPESPRPTDPTAPSPDTPEQLLGGREVSSPAERYENIDSALQAGFWKVVLLLKLSLIGLTLGGLLALFLPDFRPGVVLLAGAVALFGYTVREAKQLKARADGDEFDHELADETTGDDSGRAGTAAEGTD